jgi:hypothetical protein
MAGSELVQVKNLKNFSSNLKIDWLTVLNELLLNSVKLSEDDEVQLYSPKSLKSISKALETLDKRFAFDDNLLPDTVDPSQFLAG